MREDALNLETTIYEIDLVPCTPGNLNATQEQYDTDRLDTCLCPAKFDLYMFGNMQALNYTMVMVSADYCNQTILDYRYPG